jgi:hypothetical protein
VCISDIQGLGYDDIKEWFEGIGKVESLTVYGNGGVLVFEKIEDASKARDIDSIRIQDVVVRIGKRDDATKSLWVGNIAVNTRPGDLEVWKS